MISHGTASGGDNLNIGLPIIGVLVGNTQAATTQLYAHIQGYGPKPTRLQPGCHASVSRRSSAVSDCGHGRCEHPCG